MLAGASLGLIALYQMSVIQHLPEPVLPYMNADEVDASAEAFERFSMPDAILGVGQLRRNMGLAAMGPSDRARPQPWIPLALAAKTAYDVYNAGQLTMTNGRSIAHLHLVFGCRRCDIRHRSASDGNCPPAVENQETKGRPLER